MDSTYLLGNKDIRKGARERLSGNWLASVLAIFIYLLLAIGASLVPVLGILLTIVIEAGFTLGLAIFFLIIVRGNKAEIGDMFKGFNNYWKALGALLLVYLFVFLWTLLLIIPGIIAAIRYSQTFYILADNPDIKVTEAINLSKKMMSGVKCKYFLLNLSFIGWSFLALFTLGIGYLWLLPYIMSSQAIFYDDLKRNHDGETIPNVGPTSNDDDSPIRNY